MPKNSKSDFVKIKSEKSSLAEFTRRPLPTEEEVENFEEFISEEAKEEEIEESLNEIYQDDDGHMVDVKKMESLKKRGFFFWLFSLIIFAGLFGGGGYAAYRYLYPGGGSDAASLDFRIEGSSEVVAGEEFSYALSYENNSGVGMKEAWIEVKMPEKFVLAGAQPEPDPDKKHSWNIGEIPPYYSGKVILKGVMLGKEKDNSTIFAALRYTPENFSSEFKKEAVLATIIKETGMEIAVDHASNVLVNEKNELGIKFSAHKNNYIKSFRLTFVPQENVKIIGIKPEDSLKDKVSEIRPGVWIVNEISEEPKNLKIEFQFTEKKAEKQNIALLFEAAAVGMDKQESFHEFMKQEIEYEVMKSDLNLALIVNGKREDQGVDFGEKLNYSIVYNNKGETAMKDVVIMAVIDSDALDWTTFDSKKPGKEKGHSITWSKNELPELESVDVNEEGTIDFSVNVGELKKIEPGLEYRIESYAQYNVGADKEDGSQASSTDDNRSNKIVNIINSDLKLKEEVRYFSSDNIPVGTGPNPPKVGESSSFKVYWTINNNLHELKDLEVRTRLPENVVWNGKERATVGSIYYNDMSNEVVWSVGRLPVSVFQTNAEFSIGVSPSESDRNKIMVLVSGTSAKAVDSVTSEELKQESKAKTTKLEDDDIAGGDGIVE